MDGGGRSYTIKECDYEKIVFYFNNSNDNTTSVIAKKLNLNVFYVSYIIDVYLSKKRNYMGTVPVLVSRGNRKHRKVIVYDKNNDVLDIYNSVNVCARELGISRNTVSRSLNKPGVKNHKGYTFNYYNVNKIS